MIFREQIGSNAFLFLYPAIFLGCFFGTRLSSIFATGIAAIAAWFLFLTPSHSFGITPGTDIFSLIVFIMAGLLASLLSDRLIYAQQAEIKNAELLKKSMDELDQIVEASPSFLTILSVPDFRYLKSNPEHRKLSGKTEEILGKTVLENEPDFKAQGFIKLLNDVVKTGKPYIEKEVAVHYENTGDHGSKTIYLDLVYHPLRDPRGHIYAIAAQGNDVTEKVLAKRKMEESAIDLEHAVQERTRELKDSQAFLDSVIENLPNMVFVKDAQNLRFVRFNKAGEELLGYSRLDLIGKNDFDFFPKNEAEHFVAKDREVLAGRSIFDIPEETIETKSNGQRILHTRKIPIFGSDGHPEYLLGISEDITDKKKLEAERLQLIQTKFEKEAADLTAARLRFLSDASATLGSSLELESILTTLTQLCVPTIADWCSVQLLQPNGKLKQLAFAHKDPEKIKWAWDLYQKFPSASDVSNSPASVMLTGQSELNTYVNSDFLKQLAFNAEHLQIIESLSLYSYICVPIRTGRNILGTLTLVTSQESGRRLTETDLHLTEDLCTRAAIAVDNAKIFQEAQNLNRVKDEFLATLSHELRTPINVIQGHADILLSEMSELSNEEIKMSLSTIQRNTRLQTQIVSDLLDVSAIITGKVSCLPQILAPKEIANAVLNSIRPTALAKDIKISLETSKAPEQMLADPTRLHQILWNLVNNSVKFTPSGGSVKVKIEKDHDNCVFHVEDTGIGIDRDFLPYVFDRFRQADSSMARHYGGLGLGLSIVKSLSEIHGGTVTATSAGKGQGATFTALLPLRPAFTNPQIEKPTAITRVSEKSQTHLSKNHLTILLIEDSADNRILVRTYLKKIEATVLEADSAEAARQILKQHKPDLIISDIGMPDEDGLEFIRKFRRDQTDFIPAIALTAYVRNEEVKEALDAGFQAHIAKPVSKDALFAGIAKVTGVTH